MWVFNPRGCWWAVEAARSTVPSRARRQGPPQHTHCRDFFTTNWDRSQTFRSLSSVLKNFRLVPCVWSQSWWNRQATWEVAMGTQGKRCFLGDTSPSECVFRKILCVLQSLVNFFRRPWDVFPSLSKQTESLHRLGDYWIWAGHLLTLSDFRKPVTHMAPALPLRGRQGPRHCPKQLPVLQLLTWIFPKCVSG